jgi:hypothetical protein
MGNEYLELYKFLLRTNLDGFKIKDSKNIQLKVNWSSYNYNRYLGTQYENALKRIIQLKFGTELKSIIKNRIPYERRHYIKEEFYVRNDSNIRKIKDAYTEKEFNLNDFLDNYDPITEYKRIFKSEEEKGAFKDEINSLLKCTNFELFKPQRKIFSSSKFSDSAQSIDLIVDNKLIDIKTEIIKRKVGYKVISQLIKYYICYLKERNNILAYFDDIKIEYLVLYYARQSYYHKVKVENLFCIDSLVNIVDGIKDFCPRKIESITLDTIKLNLKKY